MIMFSQSSSKQYTIISSPSGNSQIGTRANYALPTTTASEDGWAADRVEYYGHADDLSPKLRKFFQLRARRFH